MVEPDLKPLTPTITDRTRGERSAAAEAVKATLASDGWAEIEAAINDRLRYEQRMAMASKAGASSEAMYERMIGGWTGLRKVRAIADGIVNDGEQAEREIRKVA